MTPPEPCFPPAAAFPHPTATHKLIRPPHQSDRRSTHLSLRSGGHPHVLSESTSPGQGTTRFGPGAPGSASVLVGSLVGRPGKEDTHTHNPPLHTLPFTTTRRQRSAKLLEQRAASLPPTETQNHLFFVFSFLLLGRFPAIKSFLGVLQKESGHPIHLLNQSEQCGAGRRQRPPGTPLPGASRDQERAEKPSGGTLGDPGARRPISITTPLAHPNRWGCHQPSGDTPGQAEVPHAAIARALGEAVLGLLNS